MAFAPISAALFQDLWDSAVDETYSRPFLENPVNSCFEVWGQEFTQFDRTSQAIDVTTQAMFILPWSGQSNPSAAGAANATVMLSIARSGYNGQPLIVDTVVVYDESTNDASITGPVPVDTGRSYSLVTRLVFNPGETGPFLVEAVAAAPGYGYNNPLPGTITVVEQVGGNLSNVDANYTYIPGGESLIAVNVPDTPIPQHVGQYMRFTTGVNRGAIKRVINFGQANPLADVGGVLYLESMSAVEGDNPETSPFPGAFPPAFTRVAGADFIPGEKVQIIDATPVIHASGIFVKQTIEPSSGVAVMSFTLTNPSDDPLPEPSSGTYYLIGYTSGAVSLLSNLLLDASLTDDLLVGWEMVSWTDPVLGFGITVTNPAQPQGGTSAMLDELGSERDIFRASNESDLSFSQRVHQLADTVSPNAIQRAANRIMEPYGFAACFRETGSYLWRGFFYDGGNALLQPSEVDAWDVDFTLQPSRRHRTWLDYLEFRAFFWIGVPQLGWGEFGFAYDVGAWDAYDTVGPNYLAFYDGYPWATTAFYLSIYNAVDAARAAGVGFKLYQETMGCTP